MTYPNTWDLEAMYPGGVEGEAFQALIQKAADEGQKLAQALADFSAKSQEVGQELEALVQGIEHYEPLLSELFTYNQMCADVNVRDEAPVLVRSQLTRLVEPYELALLNFYRQLGEIPEGTWTEILEKSEKLHTLAFNLEEMRQKAQRLLAPETEDLLTKLKPDGLAAWSNIYDTVNSNMTIPVEIDGEEQEFSVGQVLNRFQSDEDPKMRDRFFIAWEKAFSEEGQVFQDILNHLAGYRRTVQKAHGYEDFLSEPLEMSRMQKATLEAMWQAVDEGKEAFVKYLRAKQDFQGLEELGWQDFEAPLTFPDQAGKTYTWDEACEFVITLFREVSPKMGAFAEHAIKSGWVEAKDRPGKRPGAYNSSSLQNGESRVFMTFTGSASDVSTLAHELGHAFHTEMLRESRPWWQRGYAMNVAETASTFAETVVANASLAASESAKEHLQLLSGKLENPVAMFMDIHARFLFEKSFYEEQAQGFVSESRLNELMEAAQKEAFGGALDTYHPHFWCSKLHFFIDDVPFYNFPYTFGYLFSMGIYQTLTKDMSTFEERYIALLEDTGAMSVEDLAKKHLGVDLTQPDFWRLGVQAAARDAEAFQEEIAKNK